MTYGKGLKIVNSAERRAKRAAWFRDYYARTRQDPRSMRGNPWNLMRIPGELEAIRFPALLGEHIDLVDAARIRMAFCAVCGNHRVFNPDLDGRCRPCRMRLRLFKKIRDRATGKWGTLQREAKKRRRALRIANGGTVTAQDWIDVLKKYGTRCLCCGSDAPPTMDHVVPLALGGPHDKTNLQPLCHMCNSTKRDTIADYRPDRPLAPMRRDPAVVRYVHGTE